MKCLRHAPALTTLILFGSIDTPLFVTEPAPRVYYLWL